MLVEINNFITYLSAEKHASSNTAISYQRDLTKMAKYLKDEGITSVDKVTKTSLQSYILHLEKEGRAPATISRNIASIKALFLYLLDKHLIDDNPAFILKAPKIEKKMPSILTVEEMDKLLNQPSGNSLKEIRDKAMLEMLYATGLRVSELIGLKVDDVNMDLSYISLSDNNKNRMVPFNQTTKQALQKFLTEARPHMVRDDNNKYLFINCQGNKMSRQGFWKLVKHYVKKAGLETDIAPHTMRHTFASHLIDNGADLGAVKEMLGHSDISTTQMYVTMNKSVERLKESYQALPRN